MTTLFELMNLPSIKSISARCSTRLSSLIEHQKSTFHFLNDRDYTANKMNCFKVQQAFANQVTDSVRRNESACAVPENIIFAVAGFDAPQMNFVS